MTTPIIIGIIGLFVFLLLIFSGIPVALSMLIVGIFGSMFLLRQPMSAFGMASDTIYSTFTSYTLSVAPVFMLMGDLATETGIGNDLYTCFQKHFYCFICVFVPVPADRYSTAILFA